MLDQNPQRKKWDDRGIEAQLLGFDEKVESYRLWVQSQERMLRSKNVRFPIQSLFITGNEKAPHKSETRQNFEEATTSRVDGTQSQGEEKTRKDPESYHGATVGERGAVMS